MAKQSENNHEKPTESVSKGADFSFNHPDVFRDAFMLRGALAKEGYDRWWHTFVGYSKDTGEARHFFIEFFTVNPASGGDHPIFGQLEENKKNGIGPSYMMVNAGSWGEDAAQIHRFFGWNHVTVKEEVPFIISADDCFLSETRTIGRVEVGKEEAKAHPEYLSDSGKMIWDLNIDKKIAFNVGYGVGKNMRDVDAFQVFWHAQGMKTLYSGTVYWNGDIYEVSPETCCGYADKKWGVDYTSPCIWLSSNSLSSNLTGRKLEHSVFDIGGGRPKVGPLAMEEKILSAIWYEGTPYEFNFSKFWTMTRTNFKCRETKHHIHWRIEQETPMHMMKTEIDCEKKDMIKSLRESPDGEMRHTALWSGGNGSGNMKLYKKSISLKKKWEWELIDDIDIKNAGCEYGVFPRNMQTEDGSAGEEKKRAPEEKEMANDDQ